MAKQILIDSSFGMIRTAISDNGELVDFYEESPDQGRSKGNIYRGVVKRVDAPIQAAFVKFSGGRDGFLPLRDASAGKPPKPGDTVLVQVVKDEVGDKGAALTAKLSLSGRYLVYIPERDGEGGISSKITDEERAALKKVLGDLRIPDGASVILRTAATDKSAEALQEDLDKLVAAHRDIAEKFDAGGEPALLYREAPPVTRYLREYYAEDVARVWVNSHEAYEECSQFFGEYERDSAHKVELSHDGPLLFHKMGLEAEVEKLALRRVGLKSGANIVIEQAEALVAIDVNSAKASGRGDESKAPEGKGKGKRGRDRRGGDLEETVFAVNKEAAAEIGKQLRLRDLGGIIIVDFIDMESEKHRRQVEEAMRKALAADKAKIKVYEISPLGTLQISRQRLRKSGHQFTRLHCEACQGRGWHPSASAGALGALRKVEERLHGKKSGPALSVSVPYPVANKLMNEFREHLLALEKRHGCVVRVIATGAASGDPVIAILGGGESAPRNVDAPAREAQGRDAQAHGPRVREGGREDRQGEGHGRVPRERDGGRGEGGQRDGREARNPQQVQPVRAELPWENRASDPKARLRSERDAQAAEARAREGRGPEAHNRDGRSQGGRGRDGRNRDGRPQEDRNRPGQGRDHRGRDDRGRDGRDRDGKAREALTVEAQAEAAVPAAPAAQGQIAPGAEQGRDRQGGREERGGRRRRGGRGRGRGRDGRPREGGNEGQRPQGEPREGAPVAPVTADGGGGTRMPEPEIRQPRDQEWTAPVQAAGAGAPSRSPRESAAPAWEFSAKAEGAARGPEAAAVPGVRAPRARKEAKPPVAAIVKATAKKKGPQPVRPGSGRPAPEAKARPAKAEGARAQGTKAQASPIASEAAAPAKAAKAAKSGTAKKPAARAVKEGGAPARSKGKG